MRQESGWRVGGEWVDSGWRMGGESEESGRKVGLCSINLLLFSASLFLFSPNAFNVYPGNTLE